MGGLVPQILTPVMHLAEAVVVLVPTIMPVSVRILQAIRVGLEVAGLVRPLTILDSELELLTILDSGLAPTIILGLELVPIIILGLERTLVDLVRITTIAVAMLL